MFIARSYFNIYNTKDSCDFVFDCIIIIKLIDCRFALKKVPPTLGLEA